VRTFPRATALVMACLTTISATAQACPEGQPKQCIVPRPGGCLLFACVPDTLPELPDPQVVEQKTIAEINGEALKAAITGKEQELIDNRLDCAIFVTAALATLGAEHGGAWGALAGGAAGASASRVACRKAFPIPESN